MGNTIYEEKGWLLWLLWKLRELQKREEIKKGVLIGYTSDCRKTYFTQRKGLGNGEFPKRNPQDELCPSEENRAFQDLLVAGTNLFVLCKLEKSLKELSFFQRVSTLSTP